MEKNYVVNVKTAKGTIVTARGDSAEELINNINALIAQGADSAIATLEASLTGGPRVLASDPVALVQASLGGEIVTEVPAFAPKAPPASAIPASSGHDKACIHGTMVKRTGNGAKGEWKGYFCPTPKGTADQCSAVFANRNTPEWNSF